VPSERAVVDQSYQVGLNLVFADKAAEVAYQIHPLHLEFVDKSFKPNCLKAIVYDFA
jgi:Stress responsive A/B Barrel Domain